jgi:hypothetical protein
MRTYGELLMENSTFANSVDAFYQLVTQASYQGDGSNTLTNVTFFMGAGFSKAWDSSSPAGYELFTFPKEFLQESPSEIQDLLTQPGYPPLEDTSPETFKELVYQLDMQLKYPGIRTRYMDENSIQIAYNELKALTQRRFEEISVLNYYNSATDSFPLLKPVTGAQKLIVQFFRWLRAQQDGSQGYLRGLHVDFLSTNYDYVIETILDNIIDNESVLRNTYRGITPSQICGRPNQNVIHDYWAIDTLIKINGGFEIIRNHDGAYHFDYRQRSFEQIKTAPPELMMPSKEQNYTNHYFSSIFPKAVRLLQESQVLVIVGYNLSGEDALLRFLIRQFAEDLRDINHKYIFYIDYLDENVLTKKLQGCFRYINYMDVNHIFAYSGGLLDWIREVLAATGEQP